MLSQSLSLVPKTLTEMRCHLKNTGKREAKVKFFFVVVFFYVQLHLLKCIWSVCITRFMTGTQRQETNLSMRFAGDL